MGGGADSPPDGMAADRMAEQRQESRTRRPAARLARALVAAVVVILLLPYLIVPLYLVVRPVSTLMVWRWATGQRVERRYVPLDRIAAVLPLTVILAEDGRYCTHHGVDLHELREAIAEADTIGDMRGGSTIAQQAAKNLFLWPGRSYVRKALEIPLALWLDFVLGKRRLMEVYLNIAEWGPGGEFGAEAGARRAFGKPALRLSPYEAGLMAAELPNPLERDPRRAAPGLRRLAGIYQGRAVMFATRDACLYGG
jgi:monofunctional biosynthetic peptidoglycan transglycosylase